MILFTLFFYGFFFSFVGSITPSMLNMTALKISLEKGKEADFIVIDQNPFEIDVNKINQIKVLKTILAGETVYQSAP